MFLRNIVVGLKMIWLFQSVLVILLSVYFSSCISLASDTLSNGQPLFVNQTLISKKGKFELGFFRPGNSTRYYLGIWYKNIAVRTIVWVANRGDPLRQPFNNTQLLLSNLGLTIIRDGNTIIWAARGTSNATEAVLLDTGNLVVRDGVAVTWQSFDYPTDTWLPGGKIGLDKTTNTTQLLTSWKNSEDPSPGIYSIGVDPNGTAELFIWRNGSQPIWRSGTWNGTNFSFLYELQLLHMYNFSYVQKEDMSYVTYNVSDHQFASTRLVMELIGQIRMLTYSERDQKWLAFWQRPSQQCEVYALCGAFGLCISNYSPLCSCLPGFEPRSLKNWLLGDFSGGCIRRNALQCDKDSAGYEKLPNIKMPVSSQSLAVGNAEICEFACTVNCSCIAYAYGNRGCLLWIGDLLDLEQVENNTFGEELNLKLNSFELPAKGNRTSYGLPLAVSLISAALAFASLFCYLWRKKLRRKGVNQRHQNLLHLDLNSDARANNSDSTINNNHDEERRKNYELAMFSFSSVAAATNNFSNAKKLAEGGFGPVYKGELLNGHSVAVKRLSKRSGQGLEEFRNETELISKLQHRNLVGILGCCIEQDEMILVYEYMPNKSLDSLLFDPSKRELLDWRRRVQIIEGIAQGLLYLHQYSRLRIIHRDLKASNILLDGDMNPKISDFGMARIFGGNVLQANTNRIVGTYGYMSPEYAMEGLFSIKSDVFAFGILLLEIISGKKNTGFYGSAYLSLIRYAWELWKNDRALELIDSALQIPSSSIPLRFIIIGLLCVQDSAADRPTMSDVVAMLSNEQTSLASPKEPAFTAKRMVSHERSEPKICSINDVTLSAMEAR